MKKYTAEQKQEVLKFFEDGCTVQEIFEASNIPKGTLYRWKSELTKPGAYGTEPLEARVADLEAQLEEALKFIRRLQQQEQRRREEREYDNQDKPRLVLGRKP